MPMCIAGMRDVQRVGTCEEPLCGACGSNQDHAVRESELCQADPRARRPRRRVQTSVQATSYIDKQARYPSHLKRSLVVVPIDRVTAAFVAVIGGATNSSPLLHSIQLKPAVHSALAVVAVCKALRLSQSSPN
jgi:hypothetical protein